MLNVFRYGPPRGVIKAMVWLSWPIIIAGKKWSNVPILKWIIRPFFARPFNEVTSIPINIQLPQPGSVPLPQRLVERLIRDVDEKFILNECICRRHNNVLKPPRDLGCMVLGPSSSRIHPTNGRRVSTQEAIAHVHRAAKEGLIANIAHVWIDPLAFWTNFSRLMFVCFCDDVNCLYRTYMTDRGPTLDGTYKKLPGITVNIGPKKCDGCGICVSRCFVAAITMKDGKAVIDQANCRGCGKCVEVCPQKAAILTFEGEDKIYAQIKKRILSVSQLPFRETPELDEMIKKPGKGGKKKTARSKAKGAGKKM